MLNPYGVDVVTLKEPFKASPVSKGVAPWLFVTKHKAVEDCVQALKRGDIDAMLSWEPFESQVVAEGAAYFATNLVDYSKSKAVGQELGLLAASGEAYSKRREVIKRFMWAYLNAEAKLAADSNAFINTYSQFTGLPLDVTRESHKLIKLGGVLDRAQVSRLAEASFKQGVIQVDVTKAAADLYDDSLAREIRGR